ncbi:MAG: LamG domain-containing protein [Candidatus Marinimicrobia bacterium]|nr:LamG domain-containing protein [Candidatus Neomarinimicrobiota bacterium]
MKCRYGAIWACAVALGGWVQAAEAPGKLLYPARTLDFEEGTIEFHYRFEQDIAAEFLPTGERYVGLASFFSIYGADGGFGLAYFGGAGMAPEAGHYLGNRSTTYPLRGGMLSGQHVVPTGTWTHVAVVWSGNAITCWIDGKRTGGTEFSKAVRYVYGATAGQPLAFGGARAGKAGFVLDNLRVSKVARRADEFTLEPENRRADVYTTIWDTFESLETREGRVVATRPAVLALGEAGKIMPGCRPAEGVSGQGLYIP